jgi:acetyl-CoA carboxylase carboxyl transferase subunit beta
MGFSKPGIKGPKDPKNSPFQAPEGFWVSCPACHAILQRTHIQENMSCCPECNHHYRVGARRRLDLVLDSKSFVEEDADLVPRDVLEFLDSKPYAERLEASFEKTRLRDALVSGSGSIRGIPVQVGAFDFSFMGGSMGMVVGEKVSRVFERAIERKQAAILFHSSGGARMQEGLLSLMQMAKTTGVLSRLRQAQVPYVSVLTDPTTGGVAASFAMLGDLHVAEPNALVGFAGPRVISQTINQTLPEGFQRAEFLLEHGMIDAIVSRQQLPEYLSRVIKFLM